MPFLAFAGAATLFLCRILAAAVPNIGALPPGSRGSARPQASCAATPSSTTLSSSTLLQRGSPNAHHSLRFFELDAQIGSNTLPSQVRPRQVPCASQLKLVVNTHVSYAKALENMMTSLKTSGFTRFKDVVVFRGGAARNSAPHQDGQGVTYLNLTANSFDYHGLSGLFKHRGDASVCADAYLYTLDTVEFDDSFPGKFASLASVERTEVRMPPRPNSNILAFGHGVVERYERNFDLENPSKADGLRLEIGDTHTLPGVREIESFASKFVMLGTRQYQGTADPFHTGHPRQKFYYPEFGIIKYILWGQYGDIGFHGAPLKDIP